MNHRVNVDRRAACDASLTARSAQRCEICVGGCRSGRAGICRKIARMSWCGCLDSPFRPSLRPLAVKQKMMSGNVFKLICEAAITTELDEATLVR